MSGRHRTRDRSLRRVPLAPRKAQRALYQRMRRLDKLFVFVRDGVKCVYCGNNDVTQLTIDHRVPLARGGLTHPDNLVTACWDCNQRKGNDIWRVSTARGIQSVRGRA